LLQIVRPKTIQGETVQGMKLAASRFGAQIEIKKEKH
jgi:hypothetical protein